MGLFSEYKAVNNKEIHRAVMLSCMLMKCPGAQYFMYKDRLVVAYTWDSQINGPLMENPFFQKGVNILMNNLPQKYDTVDIWDSKKKSEVPVKILEQTGYVSLYHPEWSRE